MAENEGRVAQLLRDVADEMPVDPELERRTLHRARRRRIANASLVGLIAVVLMAGSFAGLRALMPGDPTLPGGRPSPTASPSVEPTGSPVLEPPVGLPEAVARTWSVIMRGVEQRDFDALASVIDPKIFTYNAGDGSNPVPEWRQDPSVLDAIPTVLVLDYAVRDIEGYGTFFIWPYLFDVDLTRLSERQRADLHALGFSDADIEVMIRGEISGGQPTYLGPRIWIRADGVWAAYVTGGD